MQMLEYSQNMQIGLLSYLCKVPSTQAHSLNVRSQETIKEEQQVSRASKELFAREGCRGT